MNEILRICDWDIRISHFEEGLFANFLKSANDSKCDIWLDWWTPLDENFTKRMLLRAPTKEALEDVIGDAAPFIEFSAWKEASPQNYQDITKDGETPSLREIKGKNSNHLYKIIQGLYRVALLSNKE